MKAYKMKNPPLEFSKSHTSKGNQLKWFQDGYWYKANQFGYENIAESVITDFLNKTEVPFAYVQYEQVHISYENQEFEGCRSRDFYEVFPDLQGYELIPLERLYRLHTGQHLARNLNKYSSVEEMIDSTVEFVENVTGLNLFHDYLSYLIQVDTFFLNEDRHTNNIAVLWNPDTDEYAYCPYFDFGASLFSDITKDYPLEKDFYACRKKIQAKPFSADFDEQLDVVEKISDKSFFIPMSVSEIRKEMERLFEKMDVDERIKHRVTETVAYQATKYTYMVKR